VRFQILKAAIMKIIDSLYAAQRSMKDVPRVLAASIITVTNTTAALMMEAIRTSETLPDCTAQNTRGQSSLS
jgi:hypothetical protein